MAKIKVQNTEITIVSHNDDDYISLTDMAGSNNFVLSVKTWIEKPGAIGIFSKAGRYGGTYAH